jgi:hypothetical protein
MKRTHIIFACALVLALAGAAFLHAAEEGRKDAKATVRSIHGTVQYLDNGSWLPVKPNMKFDAGITIRTGPDGTADISVNGTASAVRLTNNTVLQITTMTYVGSAREGDTTTMLNLETGTIVGNVKKISASSRYEIITPHGVAGIRGTDFRVDVRPIPVEELKSDGIKFDVTFSSITGIITVSAVIDGETVTRTLKTGTSWEIGHNPREMPYDLLQYYQGQIFDLIRSIEAANNLPPGPIVPIRPPFPGGPPRGPPSS